MLADGWRQSQIGDLATIITGSTPPTQNASSFGDDYPFVTPGDLGETKYIFCADRGLSASGLSTVRAVPAGSVLFTSIGSTIGKIGIAGTMLATNQQINAIVPRTVDGEYLYYALLYRAERIKRLAGVQAVPIVNKSSLAQEIISLPKDPGEQRAIAQTLSSWDAAIEKLNDLIVAKRKRKRGLMQVLLTGKKRFKEFEHLDWERRPFERVFTTVSGKSFQIKKSEYREAGAHPVVDQGKTRIAGYSDSASVFRDVPIIVFGDHTRSIKWIDFPFVVGADGTQLLKTVPEIITHFGYYLLQTARIPNLGYSRHFTELKENVFWLPSSQVEQQKIVEVLSTADAEIENLQQQLDAYKLQKRGLMQQLLTGKKRVKVNELEAVA